MSVDKYFELECVAVGYTASGISMQKRESINFDKKHKILRGIFGDAYTLIWEIWHYNLLFSLANCIYMVLYKEKFYYILSQKIDILLGTGQ